KYPVWRGGRGCSCLGSFGFGLFWGCLKGGFPFSGSLSVSCLGLPELAFACRIRVSVLLPFPNRAT
ncbi:hypothetical protein ACTHSI_07055, partial [Neisseria sp. P0001.S004]